MSRASITVLLLVFLCPVATPGDTPKLPVGKGVKLQYNWHMHCRDGGSLLFEFEHTFGRKFYLLAMHNLAELGGHEKFNAIYVLDSVHGLKRNPVKKGSNEEVILLRLLKASKISKTVAKHRAPPTKDRLSWLVNRIQNRSDIASLEQLKKRSVGQKQKKEGRKTSPEPSAKP
jgi:hypothetical protein